MFAWMIRRLLRSFSGPSTALKPEVFELLGRYGIPEMTGVCPLSLRGHYGIKTMRGNVKEAAR